MSHNTHSRGSSPQRSEHLKSSPVAAQRESVPTSASVPGAGKADSNTSKINDMPAAPSSPVSTLSSLSSDDFAEQEPEDGTISGGSDGEGGAGAGGAGERSSNNMQPPSKRRRINAPAHEPATPLARVGPGALLYDESAGVLEGNETDVSSDTTGSVPASPVLHGSSSFGGIAEGSRSLAASARGGPGKDGIEGGDGKRAGSPDEEALGAEQIRSCHWEGCDAGNLGDQDSLVRHINEQHVGIAKKSPYTCEWVDCKAKGKTQMSAYALRAHMRSHTKEKPFYCSLPECDRSFTRSDALSKHMRTVHETESVKTLDQYPKPAPSARLPILGASPEPAEKPQPPKKIRLILGSSDRAAQSNGNEASESNGNKDGSMANNANGSHSPGSSEKEDLLGAFEPSLQFTDAEIAMPRRELFRLLRRQINWAEKEGAALQHELETLEALRKAEWIHKEYLLENAMEADFARAESKGVFGSVEDGPGGVKDAIFGSLDLEIVEELNSPPPEDQDEAAAADAKQEKGQKSTAATAAAQKQEHPAGENDKILLGRPDALRVLESMEADARIASKLPLEGARRPWYRDAAQRKIRSSLEQKAKASKSASSAAPAAAAAAAAAPGSDADKAARAARKRAPRSEDNDRGGDEEDDMLDDTADDEDGEVDVDEYAGSHGTSRVKLKTAKDSTTASSTTAAAANSSSRANGSASSVA